MLIDYAIVVKRINESASNIVYDARFNILMYLFTLLWLFTINKNIIEKIEIIIVMTCHGQNYI